MIRNQIECLSGRKLIGLFSFLILLCCSSFIVIDNLRPKIETKETIILQSSSTEHYTQQWIDNGSFENSTDSWYSVIEGDSTDLNMNVCEGCANFEILGEKNVFSIISDPPSASDWAATVNPNFPNQTDIFEITNYGCRISHEFDDVTAVQNPCVHWDQNITLPINISDYIITSASIQAIVNATVDENLDRSSDNLFHRFARINPSDPIDTYSIGDFIRFYVLISDLAKNKIYEISYFQTEEIGTGNPPGKDYLFDTYMISVPEELLIFYLTSVLSTDNSNFTISLGIRLHTEDNLADFWDIDTFDEAIIKYVNLTFTYEKKIDRLTYIYWNQIGDSLEGNNLEVSAAYLNFNYKIDPDWRTSFTPNSRLKVLVNNYESDISLVLNSMNATFQDLGAGGMDITSLILKNINITLSFQIFIADTFVLDRVIKISIDDVNFVISYLVYFEDSQFPIFLFITLIISLILIAILGSLSLRAYIWTPRKIRNKNLLLRRTQKFKDINNIQALFLIHKPSGLAIFTHSYSKQLEGKDVIFSGFIQAISIIGQNIADELPANRSLNQPKSKIEEHKIIELDLKSFRCLILDIGDLRTVLVILTKASKRLKQVLFNFALKVFFEIEDKIKNFNHNLSYFREVIPLYLDEYFELYYKHQFKINNMEKNLDSIKKKYHLNHQQYRVLKIIFQILKDNNSFKLLEIIQQMSRYNEDLIIDAIELLIAKKIIVPITNF